MSGPDTSPKTVFITGAATGLGHGLATEFSRQGWRVAAGVHSTTADFGGTTIPVPLDVTSPEGVRSAVAAVMEKFGTLGCLVNNAGVTDDHPIWQTGEESWDKVVHTNLKGAFLCSRAVLRPMVKQRAGHILNISSFSARAGAAGQSHYAAAKAGLLGLTQSLAREAGSRNVRANAILPGVLPTRMTASLPEPVMEAFAAANALGRINDIDEVARFVVFLAGTRNISGQVFQLDSRTARWT